MDKLNAFLYSIPMDKYLHMSGSLVLFLIAHLYVDAWTAAGLATAAHVLKKGCDVWLGRRDWWHIAADIGAGALGAALALACSLNLSMA
jgi:hypothetical protein